MESWSVLLGFSLLSLTARQISPHPLVGNDSPFPTETTLPQEFTQILDHFNVATRNSSWNQRYWVRNSHYEAGGPVFLLLGGCYETRGEDLDSAIAWYAKQHQALMIELEHRYYGVSQPTQALSNNDIGLLSSLQALADVAFFRQSMVTELSLPEDTQWVLFGCGYGGSLAAWARFRYPHLVHGAVASSAPLQASIEIPDFLTNWETVLGHDCAGNVKDAYTQLLHLISKKSEDKGAFNEMLKKFGICPGDEDTTWSSENFTILVPSEMRRSPKETVQVKLTLDLNDKLMTLNLFNGIMNAIQNGYRDTNGRKMTVERFCEVMTSSENNTEDSLGRYAETYSAFTNRVEIEECVPYKQATGLDGAERKRVLQACTEFGHFPVVTAGSLLTGLEITAEDYESLCNEIVGSSDIASAVTRTNLEFGGSALGVSRVVFVQGGDDPGRTMGMVNGTNPESPVITIEGAFRCWDLHKPSETDSRSLQNARIIIADTIGRWLARPPGRAADRPQETGGVDWWFWTIGVAVVALAVIGVVVICKLKSKQSLRL